MDKTVNVLSVLSGDKSAQQSRKNIILSDLSRENFELAKKIMRIFSDHKTKILFYSEKDKVFLDGDTPVENIDNMLVNASLVVNLVPVKQQVSRDYSRKIEQLNISTIQNSLSTRMIFLAKNTLKKVLQRHNIKTPVFEFVGRKTAEESFANFVQPSRIFSQENHYFSEKIDTLEKMQEVYEKVGKDIGEYFIEEYIEGRDIFSFVYKKEGKIISYSIEKKNDTFLNMSVEEKEEISQYTKKIFTDTGIDSFALIHIKKSNKRGIFVLHVLADLNILMNDQGKVMNAILEQESLNEREILGSFL